MFRNLGFMFSNLPFHLVTVSFHLYYKVVGSRRREKAELGIKSSQRGPF